MRLLSLDFQNVNSLAGHWHLDFTDTAYRRSPLFAITGSTGSGKSSILDAISLAFYGRTPRVKPRGDIKKEESPAVSADRYDESCPMLTKGCTVISAAVRFEAGGIVYGSSWKRRIIKRSGRLSDPEVELIRFPSIDANEGESITTKRQEWQEAIVDVTKMTFDTFTRSVLLAQGAFSNFLKAEDDDRAKILQHITGTDIYSKIGARVYDKTTEEKKKLAFMKEKLLANEPLNEETRTQLLCELDAEKSRCEKEEARVITLRDALRWRQETDTAVRTLAEKDNEAAKAKHALGNHAEEKKRAETARRASEAIRQHRLFSKEESALAALTDKATLVRQKLQAIESGEEARQNALLSARSFYLKAVKASNDFETPYRAMIEIDTQIRRSTEESAHLLSARENEDRSLSALRNETAATKAELEALSKTVDSDTQLFEQNRTDDTIVLHLPSLSVHAEKMQSLGVEIEKEKAAVNALSQSFLTAEKALGELLTNKENARRLAEIARAADLETRRAYETASSADSPEKALVAVSDITTRIARAGELARLLDDRDWLKKHASETKLSLTSPETKSVLTLVDTFIERLDQHAEATEHLEPGLTASIRQNLDTYVAGLKEERQSIFEKTAVLSELRLAAEKAEMKFRQAKDTFLRLENQHEKATNTVLLEKERHSAHLSKLNLLEREFAKEKTHFNDILEHFAAPLRQGSPDEIIAGLQQRREERSRFLALQEKHRLQLQAAREKAIVLGEKVEHARSNLEKAVRLADEAAEKLAALTLERREKYGNLDPNREKARLNQEEAKGRQAEDAAVRALRDAKEDRSAGQARLEELKDQSDLSRQKLAEFRKSRDTLMTVNGFSDLESLLAAEMTEDAVKSIEEKNHFLENQVTSLLGQCKQASETLSALLAQKTTEETAQELTTALQSAREAYKQCTETVAAKTAVLLNDNRKRKENAEALTEIGKQEKLFRKWSDFCELIGSADGMKFRKAAQKITFRILLEYANDAMRTMTQRYLLYASSEGGLAVDVVDNDMGGQIRTSKNLSGGESFLVSLALALGLSRMGGKNLRVDTLFLDEGFGTLDEGTLNSALYALESLQQSSGKLIGIISHVKSVRDRIENHITVSQRAGSGRSTLSGPGVTRVSE